MAKKSYRSSDEHLTSRIANDIYDAADDRGHGNRTKGAGAGGLAGAVLGSFFGVPGAALGAALGAGIGGKIGEHYDK